MLTKTEVKKEYVKHVLPLLDQPTQRDIDESFIEFARELVAEGDLHSATVYRWERYYGSGIKV
jgi:hypothetical protein